MAMIRRSVVKKTSTSSFRSSLTFEFPILKILLTKKGFFQALTFIKITLNPINDNSISIEVHYLGNEKMVIADSIYREKKRKCHIILRGPYISRPRDRVFYALKTV